MNRSVDKPTLLVFTLGPECESSRRGLLPAPLRTAEAELHRQGLQRALAAGRQAGYRLVVSSPQPLDLPPDVELLTQRGCSFAERLHTSMRALQVAGENAPLLVVGTDTPDLHVGHLRAAVDLLAASSRTVLLGPSHDGGFYLLATRAPLDRELAAVRWRRRDTRRCLEAALRRGQRPVEHLEPLRDLDRSCDVERWLKADSASAATIWIRQYLRALLAAWRRPVVPAAVHAPDFVLTAVVAGRDPPL